MGHLGLQDWSACSQETIGTIFQSRKRPTLPYFYLDCGADDMFLGVNHKFVVQLQQLKIPYEFHEMPGGHEWKYWDGAIERFLSVLVRHNFAE